MKRKLHLLAIILVGLLLISNALGAEVICGKVRPLKPVRCVCGRLVDPIGDPISGVTVKVVKDGIDLTTTETDSNGTFIFDGLKSGSYELEAQTNGFLPFRSSIVVANPEKQCKRGLLIELVLGYPDNCGSFVIGMRRIGLPKKPN